MNVKKMVFALSAGVLALSSCSKDEEVVSPTISNEALTTVQLQLVNVSDATDKPTAQWEQLLDNNGNPLPVDVSAANLSLKPNATYKATLVLTDKTQTPVFDVSAEIKERANYHSFFFQPLPTASTLLIPAPTGSDVYPDPIPTPLASGSAVLNLTVTITDHDTNTTPLPIGLESEFKTGAASSGWLRIVLRHQPNLKDGTYTPGSTDMDAGFKVSIQ